MRVLRSTSRNSTLKRAALSVPRASTCLLLILFLEGGENSGFFFSPLPNHPPLFPHCECAASLCTFKQCGIFRHATFAADGMPHIKQPVLHSAHGGTQVSRAKVEAQSPQCRLCALAIRLRQHIEYCTVFRLETLPIIGKVKISKMKILVSSTSGSVV